jgi:hypothetical protein
VLAVYTELSYLLAFHPMPLKKCGHVLVAYKIAAAGLLAALVNGGARLVIKVDNTALFGGDGHKHLGGLVLLGLRQLANLVNRLFQQLAHRASIPHCYPPVILRPRPAPASRSNPYRCCAALTPLVGVVRWTVPAPSAFFS